MLALRPAAPADFAVLPGWFPDAEALTIWGGPQVSYPLDGSQLAAIHAETLGPIPARLAWAGLRADVVVGHIQLVLERKHQIGRLARIAIAPDSRGAGAGAAMVRAALQIAFQDLQIRRVSLNVYSLNPGAHRLYRRLGFRDEAVRRQAAVVGARRCDVIAMGLLRGEFLQAAASVGPEF